MSGLPNRCANVDAGDEAVDSPDGVRDLGIVEDNPGSGQDNFLSLHAAHP